MLKASIKTTLFFSVLFLILSCSQKTSKLTELEKTIAMELGVDIEILETIRELTDSSFIKASPNLDGPFLFKDSLNFAKFISKDIVGIKILEDQSKTYSIIRLLKESFKEKGYIIYLSETNFGYSADVITILKTNDKYDILRFEGTNGINYNIFIEDIISKLITWEAKYGLELVGVGSDFVQANYIKKPQNIDQHAEELYKFCPDIVDQGVGSVENLKSEIRKSNQLYLWWD